MVFVLVAIRAVNLHVNRQVDAEIEPVQLCIIGPGRHWLSHPTHDGKSRPLLRDRGDS